MKLLIPVEEHVYEFLTSSEMHGPPPLELRRDSLIGLFVIMLASKGPTELSHFYQGRICPTEISCPKLLECLTEFPLRAEFLKEDNLMYVGNALSMLFEHSAQFYTLGYMRRNGSERGGLAEFYREFRMQDDPIKQEALRAKSKRFRARNRLRAT